MECIFQEEKVFYEWLKIRKQTGMPGFKETCTVGYANGAKFVDVYYEKNTFTERTHFIGYEFSIQEGKIIEQLTFIGMHVQFENEFQEREKALFLSSMFSFFNVPYWEELSKTHKNRFVIIEEVCRGKYEQFDIPFSGEEIIINDHVVITFGEGILYVKVKDERKNPELLEDVIKKLKETRLQMLF